MPRKTKPMFVPLHPFVVGSRVKALAKALPLPEGMRGRNDLPPDGWEGRVGTVTEVMNYEGTSIIPDMTVVFDRLPVGESLLTESDLTTFIDYNFLESFIDNPETAEKACEVI